MDIKTSGVMQLALRLPSFLIVFYCVSSFTWASQVEDNLQDSNVLLNVNHIVDFLHTIKKSQDEMFQKIENMVSKLEETEKGGSTDCCSSKNEQEQRFDTFSKRVTDLETKISLLEEGLDTKIQDAIINTKTKDFANPAAFKPFPLPQNARNSRDIAYFEPPFRHTNSHINSNRPNFLRGQDRAVANQYGYTAIQFLTDPERPRLSNGLSVEDVQQSLNQIKDNISGVQEQIESFNLTHSKDIESIRRSDSEFRTWVTSNIEEVTGLREKQAELRRAIDTVLFHFSTMVLGLQTQEQKIEETRQELSNEIKMRQQRQTPPPPDDILPTPKNFQTLPPAFSLILEESGSYGQSSPPLPETEPTPGPKYIPGNNGFNTETEKLLTNLTEETFLQKQQILTLSTDLARLNASQELLLRTLDEEALKRTLRPKDCSEVRILRHASSLGTYEIFPGTNDDTVQVLCDLETDGGGWTVLQRRGQPLKSQRQPRQKFFKGWNEYEKGFGSLDGDFWIGLKTMASLCKVGGQELRIDMEKWNGDTAVANYEQFSVSGAEDNYRLRVSGYSGTAGDSLSRHNGMAFSTKDHDKDADSLRNCAQNWQGAWWYYGCHESNLNGLYGPEGSNGSHEFGTGIIWYTWTGNYYTLKRVEIKIRHRFLAKNVHFKSNHRSGAQ